jgi:hypothetical protein
VCYKFQHGLSYKFASRIAINYSFIQIKSDRSRGTNWLGDLASALAPIMDTKKKECLVLKAVGLVGVTCDMVSNFVRQAPEPNTSKIRSTVIRARQPRIFFVL